MKNKPEKLRTYSTVRIREIAAKEIDDARELEKRSGSNQIAWIAEQWALNRIQMRKK